MVNSGSTSFRAHVVLSVTKLPPTPEPTPVVPPTPPKVEVKTIEASPDEERKDESTTTGSSREMIPPFVGRTVRLLYVADRGKAEKEREEEVEEKEREAA